jgi:outer membrane receptor protein involved in Fe transport
MVIRKGRLLAFTSSVTLAAVMVSPKAGAQETHSSATPSINEIIVTANKREQSLQDVGVTIQAATGEDLIDRGIRGPDDLGKLVPGFTATKSLYSTPVYTLRGIGLYDATFGATPAVSVYTDQIPRNVPVMSDGLDLDIERVEVLKGPQGTLFGQSSTGGAVNYIIAKPTTELSGGLSTSYERFDRFELSGFLSGEMTPGLKTRVAGKVVEGGAWQRSLSRPGDGNGKDRLAEGRVTFEIEPSSSLKMTLMATGSSDRSDPQAPQYLGTDFNWYGDAATLAASGNPYGTVSPDRFAARTDPASPGYDASFLARQATLERRLNGAQGSARAAGAAAVLGTTPTPSSARTAEWTPGLLKQADNWYYQFAGRLDFSLSEAITLTSITSYARKHLDYAQDLDATVAPAVDVPISGNVKAFNQELRLQGDTGPLNWIIGASYDKLDSDQSNDFNLFDYSGNDPFYDATGGAVSLPIEVTRNDFTNTLKTYAVFGNAEFKVTDQLTLTGGLRYTNNKQKASYCYNDPASDPNQNAATLFYLFEGSFGNPGNPPIAPGECFVLGDGTNGTTFGKAIRSPFNLNLNEDNLSFRAGANYQFDDGTLLYALVSQGYKTGIFSAIGASSTSQYTPAKQEKVIAYEAGLKTHLGSAVTFNAAGFYYDYSDKQVRGRVADTVFGLLEKMLNVPKSYIWGLEGDLTVRPAEGLRLSAAGTYLKSKVSGSYFETPDGLAIYNAQGFTGDFKGSALPYTPKFSATVDGEYRYGLQSGAEVFVGASLRYQGKQNTTFRTDRLDADLFEIPNYTTVDLRAGFTTADDRWGVSVFGRNVFDKTYTTAISTYLDTRLRYTGRPATYGASLSFKY